MPDAGPRSEEGPWKGYSEEPTPLGGYTTLLAAWSSLFGGLLASAAVKKKLPRRIQAGDIVLLGVATHKLTRIVTKDWVTAPVRAPFVHYEESAGDGEVKESVRGTGLRKAVGDLLTCPWCTGPWVAGALMSGLVARPRATRAVAATFAAVAVSDFLHRGYRVMEKLSE